MDEKTELLNCPFCGCEPTLERFDDNVFTVRCTHHYCWSKPDENGVRTAADITIYADVEGKYNYETKDWEYTEEEINNCEKAAIEAWNTRAKGIDVRTKERTCHMTKKGPEFVLAGWWECSECGPVYPPCKDEIAVWALQRCPRCGARVIEDE